MKTRLFAVTVIFGCLLAPAPSFTAPIQKKVLIIGIDGTQPAVLALARTPNLNALKTNGCYSDRAVTHQTTHSAACWSSMFTGVWGDKHLINDPGNAMAPNNFENYPSFFHRLERANSNLFTVAFARWPDITNAWKPLTNFPAGADMIRAFGSDAAITAATTNLLMTNNPDVFFTILLDVDSAGHSSGWGSSNYISAIETADTRVGQIINALTNRVQYSNEDWLVISSSDHGNHDGSMEETRLIYHIVSGLSAARGPIYPTPGIVDICATVLTHIGVAIDPSWNLDARVEGLPLLAPRYGDNLIANGDAESNSGTNAYYIVDDGQKVDRGIAWWFDPTPTTLGTYGSNPSFPALGSAGPTNRGQNFFLGGIGTNNVISQTIDLSSFAADIDDPGVDFQLSGWFGGAGNRTNSAALGVRFLNSTNGILGTNRIGGFTVTDRGGVTGLLPAGTNGTLPAGTRLVEFSLAMASATATNDASADNLSFVLAAHPDLPFRLLSWHGETQHWEVEFSSKTNRLYALERSVNLESWETVSPPTVGNGASFTLTDTNPPTGQAFYRVNCRKF